MGIDSEISERIRSLVGKGYNAFKLGWARVNFNYFISPQEVDFICDAIVQIAEHGWKLLPLYEADLKSALFVHRRKTDQLNRHSLSNFQLSVPESATPKDAEIQEDPSLSFKKVLDDAEKMYGNAERFIRLFAQHRQSKFQDEFLPSDAISPNDIWWVTAKDVVERVKRGVPSATNESLRLRHDVWSMVLEC